MGEQWAETFMELLIPEDAEVLASYAHDSWKGYAAVTRNTYGKGTAVYLGCMMGRAVLEKLLCSVLQEAAVNLPEETFPVIIRKGENALGKMVYFYLNYSGKAQECRHRFSDGVDLLDGSCVNCQDVIHMEPWGVRIVEVP